MWEYNNTDELYHYGVLGMKWGKRMKRGHAGRGLYIGSTKHQIQRHKKDLDYLNKGDHLSFGITKKRQAAYDARDKKAIQKRISKLEDKQARKKAKYDRMSSDAKEAYAIKKKKVSEMSNAELRKLNERQNLERQHNSFNPSAAKIGKSAVQAYIGVAGTIVAAKAATKTYKTVGEAVVKALGKKII